MVQIPAVMWCGDGRGPSPWRELELLSLGSPERPMGMCRIPPSLFVRVFNVWEWDQMRRS